MVTHPLLPAAVFDFVFNSLMIVLLGGLLERIWSRSELGMYCVVAAAGAGLARVILQFSSPVPMAGAGPLVFGLLVAWGFLFGHEKIPCGLSAKWPCGNWPCWSGIGLVTMWFSAGLINAVILLVGGLTGLFYLWLRSRLLMARESRVVDSERINRLEL